MLHSSYRSLRRALTTALAALALSAIAAHAQLPTPATTTEDALRQMLDQSGVVFTGQVIAVRHTGSILEIDFAIDDAILGVAPNSTYTLREWAGISPAAVSQFPASQFEVARRYLMFLRAPGPGGLSSPVGGLDGAIPILPGNQAASPTTPDALGLAAQSALIQAAPIQSAAQTATNTAPSASPSRARTSFRLSKLTDSAPTSHPTAAAPASLPTISPLASSTVDLRWIAAGVLTPLSYAPDTTTPTEVSPLLAREHAFAASLADSTVPVPSQPPTSGASYSTLLTLLRSWHEEAHAPR